MLSRCCKKPVYVWSANEGTAFYVCYHCDKACDTIPLLDNEKGMDDDAGSEIEAKAITGAA